MYSRILIILLLHGFALVCQAQNGATHTQKVSEHFEFDGLIKNGEWDSLDQLSLVMQIPHFGEQPSEISKVWVAYDHQYIYLAGYLH